jgi:hypothetical protein
MMFNATFNNISVISLRSVLLVEETGVPVENHWHAVIHWQTLSYYVVLNTPRLSRIRTHKIGGGNRSTRRKPLTCCNSLTNFIILCCIEYTSPEQDSNSQLKWWQALIVHVVVNLTTMRSRPQRPLFQKYNLIVNK